jgi:hypothetical protein
MKYYLLREEETLGPFSVEALLEEEINPNTWVKREDWSGWKKVSNIPELIGHIEEPTVMKSKKSSVVTDTVKAFLADEGLPPELLGQSGDTKEDTGFEEEIDKQSTIDKIYSFISSQIDKFLEKYEGVDDPNILVSKTRALRSWYKSLSRVQQKSLSFAISCILIFMLISLFASSWYWGYRVLRFWIAFVALNQVSAINKVVSYITDIVVLFTMVFLPKSIKQIIANLSRNILNIVIALLLNVFIAPVYILYLVYLFFTNQSENLDTEIEIDEI